MAYLDAQFEDYSFSHYKDMKEYPKRTNNCNLGDGHSRSSAVSPFSKAHRTSYLPF